MEEEPQLSTHITIKKEEDEEFYENMEAPKFVDLTLPDPYYPNDRYWFCLRVGCDQKHEEEMDHEAIYKDFVLRVMAARSPNIRLRKALNGKNASTNMKCPLSAPAKSSKSRVTRLATVPSISQKMVNPKGKVHPLVNPGSTPVAKTRQVPAKYMTTPRNKMCPQNPNPFVSVQNHKQTTVELPTDQVVAKALVFQSPKKNWTEMRTPLRKICEGMKKFEIESQWRRILGYSCKSSKHNCNSKKSLPKDLSRKQPSTYKDKIRDKGLLPPQKNSKDVEAKLVQCIKSNSEGNLMQESRSTKEEPIPSSEMPPSRKNSEELSVSSRCESKSFAREGQKEDEGSTKRGAEYESEAMDGADKENALASDDYREINHNTNYQPGRKVLGGQEMHKNNQKADKNFKVGLTFTATGATEVKYRKPKPTNPKPFRLRTDERGIKETISERKFIAVSKEGSTTNESVKPKQSSAANLKTTKGELETQIATTTLKRTFKPLHHRPNSLVAHGNYNPQQQLIRPQGIASSKNGTSSHKNHGQRLAAIKETSSRVSKPLKPDNMPKEKLSQHSCTKKLGRETMA